VRLGVGHPSCVSCRGGTREAFARRVHGEAEFCALGAIVADAVVVVVIAAATSVRVVCLTAAGRAAFVQVAAAAVNALGVLNGDVGRQGSRGRLYGGACRARP
jgi:hypothetical protein